MSALITDKGGNGALIEGRELRFTYGDEQPEVVRGASLRVERGRLSAIIGANGSGKSTLVRLLAGLLRPTAGEVSLGGVPRARVEARARARRVAYVPQSVSTVFPFTALEVVLTGRSPYSSRFHFETGRDLDAARAALAAVDAAHLEARPVTELSGGERQLVALARALAQEPECLLLDELSAALDLKHRAGLIRHLRRLRDEGGMTALVVTHDLMLLDPAFDRVHAVRRGRVVAEGTPQEVLRDELHLLAVDEETAQSLGVNVRRSERLVYIAASLIVGVTVAVGGTIGFVGLIVPHAVRLLFGEDVRVVMPCSFVLGAAFLMLADAVARTVLGAGELPVGAITALAGGPVFLWLLRRQQRYTAM